MSSLKIGLFRMALAGTIALLLGGAWSSQVPGEAYLAVGISLVLGLLLVVGKPESLVNSGFGLTLLDLLWVSLLVYFTGGSDSLFSPLYLLAALGIARIGEGPKAAAATVAGVGAYLAAATVAGGAILQIELVLWAGFVGLFCGVAWMIGAAFRQLEDRISDTTSTVAAQRRRAERAEDLVPRLGPVLSLSGLDGILRWTLDTAHAAVGGSYAHVAALDGTRHHTIAEGNSGAYPSWWHPTVQRLVLWSCRENRVLRDAEKVHDVGGFMAAPIGMEDEKWGAVVLGGKEFDAADERVLKLLADAVSPVLKGIVDAPAGRDSVTGLPNRSSLYRVLERQLAQGGRALTVMAVGLDGFRSYNRVHGPDAGDKILRRVGNRLAKRHRHVFRYGGDEFVVLVPGETVASRAREAASALRRLVSESTVGPGSGLGASVGFASTATYEGDREGLMEAVLGALAVARGHSDGVAGPEVRASGAISGSTRISRIVLALAEIAEIRGPYIGEHSKSVAGIARRISESLSLSDEEIRAVEVGSLLHDLGKVGVPDHVLFKPEPLTAPEYELIKSHPALGVRILAPIPELRSALPVVNYHHERYDGRGYPDGLAGEDIPLLARVVSVADAFDAMIRVRPYGRTMAKEDALGEIERNAGTQFDPQVVQAFLIMMEGPEDQRINSAG